MAYNWDNKKSNISIAVVDGSTYYIKDAEAREAIDTLSSYTEFLGVAKEMPTTRQVVIDDGSVSGETVTAKKGDIIIYEAGEFIWNGSSWAEFGDLSGLMNELGDLAFNDEASADYTPAGTISVSGEFTGKEATITVSGSTTGELTVVSSSASGNYTPYGTIDPDIKTTSASVVSEVLTAGTVPSLTATEKTVVVSVTNSGTLPAFSNTTTSVVASATQGTLPSFNASLLTASVSGETLTFALTANGFDAGTLPTFTTSAVMNKATFSEGAMPTFSTGAVVGAATLDPGAMPTFSSASVITGVTASNPTFTGTPADITYSASSIELTGTYTPELSTVPTYSFVGTSATITVSGSVSKPTV